MAAQVGKSSLLAKYGAKINSAINSHKADETVTSNFGELPAGIENGIAQLVECKFDTYKEGDMKGEVYFYAAGIVQLPTHVGDVPVEGLRTSIMEPVCDTPSRKRSTMDDHVKWILNQFRLLGINTSNMTVQHLEAAAEALKKHRPYFRFRTWKGKPQTTGQYAGQEPRTNHDWLGVVAFNPGENGQAAALVDETGDENQSEPSEQPPASPKSRMSAPKVNGKAKVAPAPAPEPEPDLPFDDGADDLDALAVAAEDGDKEAKIKLTELAESLGVGAEVGDADDWAQGVSIIREAQAGAGTEAPADEPTGLAEGEEPAVDQLWKYAPAGKPPIDCVVTAVSKKNSTVTLKATKGGKEYPKVAWSELLTA